MKRLGAAVTAALLWHHPAAADPKIAAKDGVPVTITSTRMDTEIFLAHGDPPRGTYPDAFERVGVAPLTIKLSAGVYTIETTSPTTSAGRSLFSVEDAPLRLDVHPGDELVKTLGSTFEGLGVVAMLLGVIVIASVSPHDQSFNRWGIGLPLLLGGAGSIGAGIGLSVLGATGVNIPKASAQGIGAGIFVRF